MMVWSASTALAQLPFFPGAEGFGGSWSGTAPSAGWLSNADVYHVTTLEDDLGSDGKGAPGTLRGAFRENTSDKIIVFDVGGTIQLNEKLDIKNIQNYYIAGQTAPSPVTVYGNSTNITHSNNKQHFNTILRYMTFRRGTDAGEDALGVIGGGANGIATNIMIDHVTATWSRDENLSVTNYNTNVTVQYSLIAEAVDSSHAYGSLLRPKSDAQLSFHHNLYATDKSRNPRPGTYDNKQLDLDFRNNVIYNWSDRAGYTGGASESDTEYVNINYVGNYAIAGPLTPAGQKSQTLYTMDVSKFYNLAAGQLSGENKDFLAIQIHQSGNYVDSNHNAARDGSDTGWGMFIASDGDVSDTTVPYPEFNYGPNSALPAKRATPHDYAPVTTQSAPDAYNQVIDHVGNFWWSRDAIDSRIIGNVQTNTTPAWNASGVIDAEKAAVENAPQSSHSPTYDADNDAMEDAWETKHGGDLVWNADFDNDGYINLIEFINEKGEFPAPAPIVFNGGLNSRYAHIMNWKTNDGVTAGSNWQPSKYDEAQINSGTVVIDAVGQHAGVLLLGATDGSNGELDVTSGWLEVADTLVVGAHANGQGKLSLSGGAVLAQEVMVGFLGQVEGTGTLTGNLTNSGAILPGNSPGQLAIAGNYTQNADGVLSIDLASAASYDKLIVQGDVDLAGLLEVNLLENYMPGEGATFDVLDWTGSSSNAFDMLALPDLGGALAWDTSLLASQGVLSVIASAPILAGDYNNDGKVDAADYTVWRDALHSGAALQNETASLGIVDADDYDAWKANFGVMAELGGGAVGAVPEPGSLVLAAVALALAATRSPRRNLS
jgi:pectate lyase